MRLLKQTTYLLIALFILNSCSSDSDGNGGAQIPTEDTFSYFYEDQEKTINNWQAIRVEDRIAVTATATTGEVFAIEFNIYGDLSSANSYSVTDFEFPLSISYTFFKSNFFDFNLIALDEVNNRVSVEFSGDLYEDNFDLDSTAHFVEGSFTVTYTVQSPQIPGVGVNAEVNGANWYATDGFQSGGFFFGSNIELIAFSDDEYFIGIETNGNDTVIGDYSFDETSTVNRVIFYKYDLELDDLVPYECSGNLNLTEKNVGLQQTQIIGTFDITASNGSETIQVNNGNFNMLYNNY